jgi:hypothetical protein
MATHMLRPRHLSRFLKEQLDNGSDRLTYEQIAQRIFGITRVTDDMIDEIKRCWHAAEKRLRSRGTCAMLVTDIYFENFARKEPNKPHTIAACIALEGRPSAGIRLLTLKGSRNDPMAVAYFTIRTRNVHGSVSAIEDRATIEWTRGKLTKRVARRMIENVSKPVLPPSAEDFDQLMR